MQRSLFDFYMNSSLHPCAAYETVALITSSRKTGKLLYNASILSHKQNNSTKTFSTSSPSSSSSYLIPYEH